jgi:tRNA(Leu) C34 or U34 (ribose-2'-O)-methylase TrmL
MKYLLILNKFELSKEVLKNKVKNKLNDSKFYEDNGLILETNQNINEIIYFEEIEKILPLYKDWKELNFKTFKNDFLNLNIKTHLIKIKFLNKIPISAKSIIKKINSALKPSKYSENAEKIIYLEIIKKEKPYYRIFRVPFMYWEKFKMQKQNYNIEIVLENPEDKEEIKDFLRLCYIFNLPLNILTNKNITNLINRAKQEAKGIPYEKFVLNINKRLDGIKIGFSINSKLDEHEFKESYNKNKNNKINLIFGNEKFGLTQNLRERLDYSFRLTNETKKPLRASHTLAYILGLINQSSS